MTERDISPLIERVVKREVPMTAAEREEWGQEKPPRAVPGGLGMCLGVGKLSVEIDGVLCCPECGDPLTEGCGSSRYRRDA